MLEKSEITHKNEFFEYGIKYARKDVNSQFIAVGKYMRMKQKLWLTDEPHKILNMEKRRAQDLINLFEGSISVFYYTSVAGSEEAIKWLMGATAAHIKEKGLSIRNLDRIMPADYLKTFVDYLVSEKFDRAFSNQRVSRFQVWRITTFLQKISCVIYF